MNGEDRRELVSENLPHVFGLTQLGDYLYWTDWQRRTIDRVNKNTGSDRKIIIDQLPNLMGVKAVNLKEPLNDNPCGDNNGNCSQFCFYKPKGYYICACEIGNYCMIINVIELHCIINKNNNNNYLICIINLFYFIN